MKWSPYPKYKPSGVEWLGEVPEDWALPPLYMRYRVDLGKMLNEAAISGDHLVLYLRNVDVQWDRINVADLPWMDIGPWELARYTVRRGDLLVCEGGEVGRAALVEHGAVGLGYQKALHRLRPLHVSEDPRFLFFTLYWAAHLGIFVAGGNPNTIAHLTGEKLRAYRFPAPPKSEQTVIADFLDRATAKIDTLVAKKRTLIERLKEKRTALISRTVTRGLPPAAARAAGLDPHPRLKPSGIDWLGDVPEHWRVSPLKFLVSTPVTDGPHETPEILEEGVPFVSAEAISGGRINFEAIRGYISLEDHRRYSRKYKPHPGDIFMVKSGATTGRAAMVETETDFNIWSPLAAIRCNPKLADRQFLFLYLQSREFQAAVELSWSYGTQQNIGMGVIQNLHVPVPLLSEQATIARYLSCATKRIDALIAKVETAIERLQEYRTALITAAVTGKIDVRSSLETHPT